MGVKIQVDLQTNLGHVQIFLFKFKVRTVCYLFFQPPLHIIFHQTPINEDKLINTSLIIKYTQKCIK